MGTARIFRQSRKQNCLKKLMKCFFFKILHRIQWYKSLSIICLDLEVRTIPMLRSKWRLETPFINKTMLFKQLQSHGLLVLFWYFEILQSRISQPSRELYSHVFGIKRNWRLHRGPSKLSNGTYIFMMRRKNGRKNVSTMSLVNSVCEICKNPSSEKIL